jgi:hypothetical protein
MVFTARRLAGRPGWVVQKALVQALVVACHPLQ